MDPLNHRITFQQQVKITPVRTPHHGTVITDPGHHITPPRHQPCKPLNQSVFPYIHHSLHTSSFPMRPIR
jgi:hypothetical protein